MCESFCTCQVLGCTHQKPLAIYLNRKAVYCTGRILVGHRTGGEAGWPAPGNRQKPAEVSQQETQPKKWHRNITYSHSHWSVHATVTAVNALWRVLCLCVITPSIIIIPSWKLPIGWARRRGRECPASFSFWRQTLWHQDLPKIDFPLNRNEI